MARQYAACEGMMFIRPIIERDVEEVGRIHALSPASYSIPNLDGKNVIEALAMVDERDRPRIVLAAEKVVELYLVIDHNFETPAFRAVALDQLHLEMRARMKIHDIRRFYAFMGPQVPKGFDRKLAKMGAVPKEWRCVEFRAEEGA